MVVYIFVGIYFLITFLLIGYDFFSHCTEKYSHFHIGRWHDDDIWAQKVEKVCKKWAINTPKLRMQDSCRYLLLDKVQGKYSKSMVQSWQKAGCILGLQERGSYTDLIKVKIKPQLLNEEGNWTINVNRIDYAMLAYSLLRQENNPENIHKAMDKMINCIETNLCADGLISYSAGKKTNRRYVDTLGFVCPFLALYGKVYNNYKYIEMAANQFRTYNKYGFINNLPVHCFQANSGVPLGIYGWGRGLGWYMLGLIDFYLELEDDDLKAETHNWIVRIAETSVKYERKDGGFSSIVQDEGSRYDSSATAMIGYFYAKSGQILNNIDYYKIAKRCQKKLMIKTKINGVIDECQGDTKDIGVFSERYSSMPFAQGITLRLSETLREYNG